MRHVARRPKRGGTLNKAKIAAAFGVPVELVADCTESWKYAAECERKLIKAIRAHTNKRVK